MDERERGDMGLARGEAPCCSTEERGKELRLHYRILFYICFYSSFADVIQPVRLPAGMMTDKAVAEADLITLVPGREFRFSPSAESCWWRTLRSTRSVVAPRGPCGSGRPRTVALLGRGNVASAGLKCLSAR